MKGIRCGLCLTLFVVPAPTMTSADAGLEAAAVSVSRVLDGSGGTEAPGLSGAPVRLAGLWNRSRRSRKPAFETVTSRTDVCSDGVYSRSDVQRWQRYQRSRGYEDSFRDNTRQDETATGEVNPFRTAYAVVPRGRRDLLYTDVQVCVLATGRCAWAKALEVGPRFGELSVKGMMDLGLNAHPQYGRYNGKVRYTFYRG